MTIADDASLYLADFGVSVTAGAVSGLGLLDQNSQMVIGDQVVSIDYGLTCEVALFGGLTYGSAITIDGDNYQVRHEPMRLDDGTFCIVPLVKLAPDTSAPGGRLRTMGLADLSDVEITDAQPGDLLVNDGEKWKNGPDDVGLAAGIALS